MDVTLTCSLEICKKPNKWKSILIGEKITMQEFKVLTKELLDNVV